MLSGIVFFYSKIWSDSCIKLTQRMNLKIRDLALNFFNFYKTKINYLKLLQIKRFTPER